MQKDQTDRKLMQQLYSRLNIKWSDTKIQSNKNPLLYTHNSGLMSKSIANKLYSSRRHKLNQAIKTQKQASGHLFTNSGIVNLNHRKLSTDTNFMVTSNYYFEPKFQKYEHTPLFLISNKINSQLKGSNDNITLSDSNKTEKMQQMPHSQKRLLRAKSAHYSQRKPKTEQSQYYSFRKKSQNWIIKQKKKTQKQEFKGWQIPLENTQIECSSIRIQTIY